ncbi:transient receptor potential cation channel subfamily A member 1 homolog [Procambarus clarkii]|uniref:transient receptor potential cation channel subfamily A member 1 homolog n=1 Tax=Procambarus clarkii TaxID=6728 RepID=UPI00374233BC
MGPMPQLSQGPYVAVPMDIIDGKRNYETNALVRAVNQKDYQLCQKLIEDGEDVKYINEKDGSTLLHILAEKYSKRETRAQNIPSLLLQHGADVNAMNKNGETPLHIAAREGLSDFCAILLEHQAVRVDIKNMKQMTPLHFAAQKGELDTLNLLIQEGANPNIKDSQKYLPLHHAAEWGYHECCKVLASFYSVGRTQDRQDIPPVMLAARKGHYRCYKEIVDAKADMNLNYKDGVGNTALHIAAKLGFEKFVDLLLETGAPPDIQNNVGNTPVMEAVIKNKVNCVKELIENGAAVSIKNNAERSVLHLAAAKKADECMEYLLTIDRVKDIINEKDNDGFTALFIAVKKHSENCAVLLLNAGASPSVDGVTQHKLCLLHLAAENFKPIFLEKLLAMCEFDVNVTNKDKETPLHLAARAGSREACQMLFQKGAQVNAVDKNGRTALHIGAYHGHSSIIRLFIKNGANKRAKDDCNSTALHAAAAKGNIECCEILTDADKSLYKEQDKRKRYALDIAFLKGHYEVFKLLLQKLPYRNICTMPQDLQEHLHSHTHKALKDRKKTGVEAIVESQWWAAGFGGTKKHEGVPCPNFRDLIKLYPFLALKVMDNCTSASDTTTSSTYYDFRIFEDNYCITEGKNDLGTSQTSPFDSKTWKVLASAKELISDTLVWKQEHPVSIMIQHRCLDLLQHSLTEAWIQYKWGSYARLLFTVLCALKAISVVILVSFMINVKNWKHITDKYNMSEEMFCDAVLKSPTVLSEVEAANTEDTIESLTIRSTNEASEWNPTPSRISHSFLLFSLVLQVFLEINSAMKLKWHYLHSNLIFVRLPCIVLTAMLLIPTSSCDFMLGIKMVPIWQCGILALLIAWIQLIQIINKLPQCSVFTISTWDFIKCSLKGLMNIGMVILLFALIFHLLLQDNSAFKSIPQSFVKTVVWMLGDLGYDDTFITEPLSYPVLVNVLFFVFICTVWTIIFTLMKAPSSNEKEVELFKKAALANYLLILDVCFPWFKRKYAVGMYNVSNRKPWIIQKIQHCIKPKESLIVSKLSQHIDKVTLMNTNKFKQDNTKHWIVSKTEKLFRFFSNYSNEGANIALPDLQQEHLQAQTKKLDQLLALCNQLNENYRKQNEQILEMKQQLDNMKQRSRYSTSPLSFP